LALPEVSGLCSYAFHPSQQNLYALDSLGELWLLAEHRQGDWRLGANALGRLFPPNAQAVLLASAADSLWVYHPHNHRLYGLSLQNLKVYTAMDSCIYRLGVDWFYHPAEGVFYALDEFQRFIAVAPHQDKAWERKLLRGLPRYNTHIQFWPLSPQQVLLQCMPSGQWVRIDLQTFQVQNLFLLSEESLRRPPRQRAWSLPLSSYESSRFSLSPVLHWKGEPQSDGFSILFQAMLDRQQRWDWLYVDRSKNGRDWEQILDRNMSDGTYEFLYPFSHWERQAEALQYYYRLRLRDYRDLEVCSPPLSFAAPPLSGPLALEPNGLSLLSQNGPLSHWQLFSPWGVVLDAQHLEQPWPGGQQVFQLGWAWPAGVYFLQTNQAWYRLVR
jgi:hypothetical protein